MKFSREAGQKTVFLVRPGELIVSASRSPQYKKFRKKSAYYLAGRAAYFVP